MIVDLFGPIAGWRHDSYVLDESYIDEGFVESQRDSRFHTSTMQTKAISCRVMAMLLTKPRILSDEDNMMTKPP